MRPAAHAGAADSRSDQQQLGPGAGTGVGADAAPPRGCTALEDGAGWGISQPGFQHQVLSTVQYMAFVHALRRFFDRAVAVARCAADARF